MRRARIGRIGVLLIVLAAFPVLAESSEEKVALPSLKSLGLTEGQVISKENLDQYEELLTPGVRWGVEQGWRLTVVEPRHVEMPRVYKKATEEHSSKVKLGKDGHQLEGYVAGLPFPNIDPNDPQAARKIMWNHSHNFWATDDASVLNFRVTVGSVGAHATIRVERDFLFGAYRRLKYLGRIYVSPKPELSNPDGVLFRESWHPILEPVDLKGFGMTFHRYVDPKKNNVEWFYPPGRPRVLTIFIWSNSLFGTDIDADSFWGYNAKHSTMRYHLMGQRTVLAPMHARYIPPRWQEPEDWIFADVWEPRQAWVIEVTSLAPQYGYGKRILYVDQEAWMVALSDIYDRAGEHWKTWASLIGFSKTSRPGASVSVYEDEMPFIHAAVTIDLQLGHATRVVPTGAADPKNEGWYLNMGERAGVTEEFFTAAHLIAGHKDPKPPKLPGAE